MGLLLVYYYFQLCVFMVCVCVSCAVCLAFFSQFLFLPVYFLTGEKEAMKMEGHRVEEGMGRTEGRETAIRIYSIKFF